MSSAARGESICQQKGGSRHSGPDVKVSKCASGEVGECEGCARGRGECEESGHSDCA